MVRFSFGTDSDGEIRIPIAQLQAHAAEVFSMVTTADGSSPSREAALALRELSALSKAPWFYDLMSRRGGITSTLRWLEEVGQSPIVEVRLTSNVIEGAAPAPGSSWP